MSKVVAIIEKPENCETCVFGVCKYSLPLSSNRKGYYCKLLPPDQRAVQDFDYDADVHLDNCLLRPIPEKRKLKGDVHNVQRMTGEIEAASWNACIDAIVGE